MRAVPVTSVRERKPTRFPDHPSEGKGRRKGKGEFHRRAEMIRSGLETVPGEGHEKPGHRFLRRFSSCRGRKQGKGRDGLMVCVEEKGEKAVGQGGLDS